MYSCAICGEKYETVEERAECELACSEKRRKEEIEKKREAYEASKKASESNIEEKLNEVNDMIKEHLNEYEHLRLTKTYHYLQYIFSKSRFWF